MDKLSYRRIATALGARKLRASQLLVVIGTPGAGKTQVALSITASLTLAERPVPILLLSPGARVGTMMEKLILLGAGLAPSALRDPYSDQTLKTNWPKIVDSAEKFSSAPLYFHTRPHPWPIDLWLHAGDLNRRLRRERKRLGLIIVDGLQNCGPRNHARKLQDLKLMARDRKVLGVPIIAFARPTPALLAALRRQRVASITLPAPEKP